MAASKSQRIGIWVIAVVMTIGTIGSFFVVILANDNNRKDQASLQELMQQYQEKVAAQATELSAKYFATFSPFASRVAPFDAASITEVGKEDLVVGDGEEIKEGTAYSAYYIGWNPSGKVFDQSIDGDKLKAPIEGGNLIEGWNEGVVGMKVGGVREISIPAAKAYGEKGSGEDIPANTPIKFVVFIIPKPEAIKMPDFSSAQQ